MGSLRGAFSLLPLRYVMDINAIFWILIVGITLITWVADYKNAKECARLDEALKASRLKRFKERGERL